MNAMETIIIGIGNPVLTDDSVGLKIADRLEERLRGRSGVAVARLCCGGIRLMETMVGYERAIVIDAMSGGGGAPGSVYRLGPDSLAQTRNTCSTHDGAFSVALELGKAVGLQFPSTVRIWGVEAENLSDYGENLSADVERAAAGVVESVMRELDAAPSGSSGRRGA